MSFTAAMTGRYPSGPVPAPSAKRRGVLLPVVGLVVLGLLAVITVGILQQAVGTGGVVVGTLAALLPVVPVVSAFLWVDRWEPEPPGMLMGAFLWGAGFAALVSLLINSSASAVLDAAAGRGAGDLFGPVVVAPVVEEFAKGLFLVGLLVLRRREFDGIVDGIVYAGIVAAGFAFSENILYIGRAVSDPETAGVVATLFVRGIASPFAHPLFTCMIGIAAGVAVASRSIGVRVLALIGGYVAAVVLHALWNGASVLAASPGAFYQIYLFVMVPIFGGMIFLVVFARRREARIVAAELPAFASAGWIAPSEVPLLARLSRRRGWRTLVRRRSGKAAAKAVADYQAAVTELAFMRNRIARGAVQDSAHVLHDEKLAAVLRTRAIAVGVPEALVAAWAQQRPSGWEPPPPPAPDGSFSGAFKIPTFPEGQVPGTEQPAPAPGAGAGATAGPGAAGTRPGAPATPGPAGPGPVPQGPPPQTPGGPHRWPREAAPAPDPRRPGGPPRGPGAAPPGPGGAVPRPDPGGAPRRPGSEAPRSGPPAAVTGNADGAASGQPAGPDPAAGPTRPVMRGAPAPRQGGCGAGADPSARGRHHDDPGNPGPTRPMRRPDDPAGPDPQDPAHGRHEQDDRPPR
ncbi:Membrane proteinase PrsW, cleaves anti-sigma factor RsiW, M82 family [Pseudonocardia ammonioxydans]|uniref:Membrane proteinase PrsW, cleaves anti-sigma factor RsiW, M82 family n=1 Tax=Pseudonocardia ammonioxydans TaxID=260086 RepID=A0A1I4SKB7_PSUAM|nr:PrsW family intramembrane metalloprotease [Pseudonocardia ammonioxydans]SFM64958.1 Membrane proteinase PrsW, cleaves anti-sigma factor RsiW, M82 family [Pseudonocardia ammonioxydans]